MQIQSEIRRKCQNFRIEIGFMYDEISNIENYNIENTAERTI